ncbi:MAG: hypothetical protein ACI80F_001146 [Natronomonas sp.]|jgi:hypothetical protein|uniref:hypothetical protein n=1 Tax=Natronomonas sp. TaxID=2184060 RepID=UPI003988AD25
MNGPSLERRSLLRALGAAGGLGAVVSETDVATAQSAERPNTDPHTQLIFAAVVDAVIPRTPELASRRGEKHLPGGLQIGLDEYLVTFTNHLFSGLSRAGDQLGDLRLAEGVSLVLEVAATELVATGGNDEPPATTYVETLIEESPSLDNTIDVAAAGLFPRLSPHDRFKAMTLLDDTDFDTTALADRLPPVMVELDLGLIGTLFVGFTEVIYYSEWQGYEDITQAPSDREFTNDPAAIQSWRQSGFPGFANGHQAFRGYWGKPDSSLGDGRVWKTVQPDGDEPPTQITFDDGAFRENDYDTSGYSEPFGESDSGDSDSTVQVGGTEGNLVYTVDESLGDGDGNLEVGQGEGGLVGTVTGPIFGTLNGDDE